MRDKALYCKVNGYKYKDCEIESGLVKNSPHKVNSIYFRIKDMCLHMRTDEVYALFACLGESLWCESMAKINKYKGFTFKRKDWK